MEEDLQEMVRILHEFNFGGLTSDDGADNELNEEEIHHPIQKIEL